MYNFKLPSWKMVSSKPVDEVTYNGVNGTCFLRKELLAEHGCELAVAWPGPSSQQYFLSIPPEAYAYAKRGQVLLAERLAKDVPEIKWVTVHPGWADTNAVEEAFGDNKKYLNPLREPWEGAEGVMWLLSADAGKLENGGFYLD